MEHKTRWAAPTSKRPPLAGIMVIKSNQGYALFLNCVPERIRQQQQHQRRAVNGTSHEAKLTSAVITVLTVWLGNFILRCSKKKINLNTGTWWRFGSCQACTCAGLVIKKNYSDSTDHWFSVIKCYKKKKDFHDWNIKPIIDSFLHRWCEMVCPSHPILVYPRVI